MEELRLVYFLKFLVLVESDLWVKIKRILSLDTCYVTGLNGEASVEGNV